MVLPKRRDEDEKTGTPAFFASSKILIASDSEAAMGLSMKTGLCAASSLDALYVWGEWIETADDANDRKVLADKFEEMKKSLEAA